MMIYSTNDSGLKLKFSKAVMLQLFPLIIKQPTLHVCVQNEEISVGNQVIFLRVP